MATEPGFDPVSGTGARSDGDRVGDAERIAAVDAVIAGRRTSLLVDPEAPVDRAVIDELVAAATWAPNHKRTWPWRFTLLTGDARSRLGEAMAAEASSAGLDPAKVAKLPAKYRRSPAVLLVWHERSASSDGDPVRVREDRDATAAAVQNVLLAATARGLASFWATVPAVLEPAVQRVAEVDASHDLVALIYLGHPVGTVVAPPRPPAVLSHLS